MSEDVKEILETLKYYGYEHPILEYDTSLNPDNVSENICEMLSGECKILLDYIINLQQELEKKRKHLREANRGLSKVIKRRTIYKIRCINLKHKLKELKQENERLKEVQCAFLGTGCKRQLEDYKSRNEKAIEYINKRTVFNEIGDIEYKITDFWFIKEILNILQGGDKE